jgi:cytidyltransferase-like protein
MMGYAGEDASCKRVYVDVVADLMHPGHVEFFKQARQFGDYLIVGVVADEDVASYKRIPILTMDERAILVGACRYVDEVVINAPLKITDEWIERHQIDFVVHGDDFDQDELNRWYGHLISLGIFRTVPYTKGVSTTELLQRIQERLK